MACSILRVPPAPWTTSNCRFRRSRWAHWARIRRWDSRSQTRSFCYVDDLIEGIVRLFERGTPEPTNLGNPHEFTVRQLADRVVQLTGSKSEIVQRPLPTDDPRVRQPDISYARRTLDWEPTVRLEEGLRRTIEYFRGVVARERAAAT